MTSFDISFTKLEEMLTASVGKIEGTDSEDRIYSNITDLWEYELSNVDWYSKAYKFWEDESNCPVDDNGVLQGFGFLTEPDVRDSNLFLNNLLALRPNLKLNRVADCGAGIGRVTKHFLLSRFQHVDLVEQSPRLLLASKDYIGPPDNTRIACVNIGLQDFQPAANTYDVIWIQWVIGHLHDLDCITFFRRCAAGLNPNGVIILKDNTSEDWTFVVDKVDTSISRSSKYIELIAQLAGLKVLLNVKQTDFPADLYPVRMFAFASN